MVALLTKSHFISGLQCPKQLWLTTQNPQTTLPNPAQQRIITQGEEVGKYARQQFPHGQLIEGPITTALQLTQTAIASGATCLFEPTFSFNGLIIRCDILHKTSAETWEIIEVKSSSKVKDEHHWDLAIQKYVLTSANLPISTTQLMHINTQTCIFPDLTNLFHRTDLTPEVDRLLPQIPQYLQQFQTLLTQPEPTTPIGKHCDTPNACPFTHQCWQHVPEISIFTIPRLDWKKKTTLINDNILAISDLPIDYPLTDNQRTYVESIRQNAPKIDPAAIATSLAQLEHPIHFFDFEAQNPAIPRFNGLKPYEQFPFQYSCHILQSDGTIEHREYLHTDHTDPRPELIAAIVADISTTGSIVVYHKSFEASLLKKMAKDFPEYATQLESIADRLWDLEDIFKHHYKHPKFRGSTSIKKVLPVLVPHLSYDTQAVQRGDQAQAVWEEMLHCHDRSRQSEMIAHLKAYCQLDTLAMVEIYKSLLAIQS
jgi:hypothetical protein